MILVDTNVWVEFFKSNPDFIEDMESLLENKKIVTIEPIFSELIYGSQSEKEKNTILSYWKVLPHIKFVEGSFLESADFATKSNYFNLGIGLIDSILIKATKDNNFLIWTLDKKILNNIGEKYIYKSQ